MKEHWGCLVVFFFSLGGGGVRTCSPPSQQTQNTPPDYSQPSPNLGRSAGEREGTQVKKQPTNQPTIHATNQPTSHAKAERIAALEAALAALTLRVDALTAADAARSSGFQ